jgi:hypothetical protein
VSAPPYREEEKALLATIRTRGHWELVIRPQPFKERVHNPRDLFDVVAQRAVDLAGWRLPIIADRPGEIMERRHRETDWVGLLHRWDHHLEVWRFYTSGQFALVTSVSSDWRDQSSSWPVTPGENWQPNALLGVVHVVRMLLQMFMFCSRLAESPVGDESFVVEVVLAPTDGRKLFADSSLRTISPHYKANVDRVILKNTFSRLELLSKLDDLTISAAGRVFEEFGLRAAPPILMELLEEVRRG